MNKDTLKGKWKQMVGSAKEAFGDFTDDELMEMEGDRDKFVGKVQERYGIAKDEAERRVDDFFNKNQKDDI